MITLTLLALLAQASSQPPAPTPPKPGDVKQNQAATGDSTAQQPNPQPAPGPPQVTNPPSGQTNPPAQQNAGDQNADATTNWWMMFFTGALTVVAYFQWRTSVDQKRLLVSVERAYVNPVEWAVDWGDETSPMTVTIKLSNSGNTRAVLREISTTIWHGDLPAQTAPPKIAHKRSLMIGAHERVDQPITGAILKPELLASILNGRHAIRQFGYFIYSDMFGCEHYHAFLAVYDYRRKKFVKEAQPEHAYEKRLPRNWLERRFAARGRR